MELIISINMANTNNEVYLLSIYCSYNFYYGKQQEVMMVLLGVAQYANQTVRFTGQIPNGSDHPNPLGVGTLE